MSAETNVLNSGGTNTIATAALARWHGFVREETVPYNSSDTVSSSLQNQADYKLTDVYNLHALMSSHQKHSTEFLKDLIYSQNAVAASYYSASDFYNEKTYAQYCSDSTIGINHAVILLGWDDNYPASNFRSGRRPKGNGAWLAKNSWGDDWGDSGYFWISYEDASLCEAGCFFTVPGDTYSTNYQYDETGWAVSISADANQKKLSGYMSNVFTAENDDPVTAVSFYTTEDDAEYEISVYKNVKISSSKPSPVNGTLVSEASGSEKYAGYHTIRLENPVDVKKGDVFSVVVKLTNHNSPYVIPMEASSATVSSGFFSTRTYLFHQYANQETDPSYISLDGSTWYVTTGKRYSFSYLSYLSPSAALKNLRSVVLGNTCVKALASSPDKLTGTGPEDPDDIQPSVTEPVTTPAVTAAVTTAKVTEGTVPVTDVKPSPAVTTAQTAPVTAPVTEPVTAPVTTRAVTEAVTGPVTAEPSPVTPLEQDTYDINRDGKVDAADLVLMIKILHGTETGNYQSDVNEDGRTNILDLILMKERFTDRAFEKQ